MKDLSISTISANLYAIPIVLISIASLVFPFIFIWDWQTFTKGFLLIYLALPYFIIAFILGSFLHEVFHAAGFIIFGKLSFNQVQIGIKWKYLTPFAHCRIPLKASVYRIALLLPAILLGLIPSIVALIFGKSWLLIYGTLFTILAGGDFLILWIIRKVKSDEIVKDHPERCGCYIINN
ncbi:MAG: metalloprotease family protein [Candidatus Tenebribacter burtonii]|jgi:hypothetical protein|nr:metalloprotease family protein [Candidatus Tenebribacter burtonii]